jgi:Zn-dependent M28 family amino/carboxypeptidase
VWRFDTANEALMNKAMPHLAALNIEKGGEASSAGPDITPLLKAGVPIFQLQQDGTDYFDYHHTADDTLDKIDAEELQQNIAAWAVVSFLAAEDLGSE